MRAAEHGGNPPVLSHSEAVSQGMRTNGERAGKVWLTPDVLIPAEDTRKFLWPCSSVPGRSAIGTPPGVGKGFLKTRQDHTRGIEGANRPSAEHMRSVV